jgi:threonine/homoserine/homoserine lactone efflux protein
LTELLLKGIVTGFILSIMIGPVFFVLLETSIRRGIRAALALDLGVLVSDVIYILLAYVFYAEVSALAAGSDQVILKIAGGFLFIVYGVYTWFKKPKEMKVNEVGKVVQSMGDYAVLALKGFLLNIANPLVVFYWFSVITWGAKASSSDDPHGTSILFYLSVILITFFSIDLLKILGAKKLRPLVTDKLLIALNHLIGIVFAIFGIVLMLQGFFKM